MTDFTAARRKMVDGQVRPSDVTDLAIIDAMLEVPREAFLPPQQQPIAYLDLDIDVAAEGDVRRRLLAPRILGRLLQAAAIGKTDRVLIVGCATGYTVAVVAQLAAEVVGTESDGALAAQCRSNLDRFGVDNAVIVSASAADGAAGNGPFDVVVLDGATEVEPQALYRQLKQAGRLVGVFAGPDGGHARVITRSADDYGQRTIFDAKASVLPGLARAPAFVF